MAYMSQDQKKKLAPGIKAVLAKYGVKGTIGVRHHSSLVVNIKEGALDFIAHANKKNKAYAERTGHQFYEVKDNYQANPYHADGDEGVFGEFFGELIAAMKGTDWFDKSDIMTDYFHTAWYLDINIGQWNKPYNHTGA